MLQWVVGPTTHVFEAARPWQTAFCGRGGTDGTTGRAIDWAAAPGTSVASQLALLMLPPPDDLPHAERLPSTVLVTVSISDLVSQQHGDAHKISAAEAELSQVGLVYAQSCSPSQCGPRSYSAELTGKGDGSGWYPDLLQPLSAGYPTVIELTANRTRAVYIGIEVPSDTPPATYTGAVTTTVIIKQNQGPGEVQPSTRSMSTRINLVIWPIAASCIAKEISDFGAAYGCARAVLPFLCCNSS
eukprot:SAG31_NODE_2159_length_6302_cov_9.311140_9_plen_243_part_00